MGTKSTKKSEVATPAPAKLPPKRKVAVRPAPPRKAAAPKAAKTARVIEAETSAPFAAMPEIIEIPNDVVAMRAYYIAEARQAYGQPGDSLTDWLEAERQIRAELK